MYLVLFFSLVVGNKWTDEWNGRVNALGNKSKIFFKVFFFNCWRSFSIFVMLKVKPSSPLFGKKKPWLHLLDVKENRAWYKYYFKALFFKIIFFLLLCE
jgi:hypothetical protein